MKKLLVLGATPFQIPIVKKAHDKGLHVTTMDNIPESPAHAYADKSAIISIIDKDRVLDYARTNDIDGIITGGSDVGVPSIGYVCDQLGLPGVSHEQGLILTRKDLFRAFQQRESLGVPEFYVFDRVEDFIETCTSLDGKFVVKPVDRSGSKGVTTIDLAHLHSHEHLRFIFHIAQSESLIKLVILERFVNGLEVGGDLFLHDGECICFSPTNKYLSPTPYYVPVGHTLPSILSKRVRWRIQKALMDILQRLGVDNGPVNFDVMVNNEGEVCVIEMSSRFGGNCIPQLIEHGIGFDEIGATIDFAIHGSIAHQRISAREEVLPTGVRILGCPKSGKLSALKPRSEILKIYESRIIELVYDVTIGDHVRQFTQGDSRIGHVIATTPDIHKLDALLNEIEDRIHPQI